MHKDSTKKKQVRECQNLLLCKLVMYGAVRELWSSDSVLLLKFDRCDLTSSDYIINPAEGAPLQPKQAEAATLFNFSIKFNFQSTQFIIE